MIGTAVRAVTEQLTDRKPLATVGRYCRLIGEQGGRHRGRMRCDAGAEIEGDAIEMIARPRRAIVAAFLQAGDVRIAKIPAARTLGEVAAERGKMPDLRRRESK